MQASPPTEVKPAVSIIIPSYNGKHLLERCLPALYTAIEKAADPKVEVIVVDDASTDGTEDWLRQKWPDIKVVSMLSNSGFTRATNAGILASRGEWLGLLNNDTRVDENWLRQAVSEMKPGVGSVATLILYMGNGQPIDSAGDSYTVIGTALKRLHRQPYDARNHQPGLPMFSACAASAFYRRSALVAVGLFDEYLGAYYDDIDVGFRLQLAGFECIYAPLSICYHQGNASYKERSFRVWYQTSRNSEIVYWSDMPGPLLWRYGFSHMVFSVLQLGPMLWSGALLPYVLGKLSVLGFLHYIVQKRKGVRRVTRRDIRGLRGRMASHWVRLHLVSGLRPET